MGNSAKKETVLEVLRHRLAITRAHGKDSGILLFDNIISSLGKKSKTEVPKNILSCKINFDVIFIVENE